jgi:hypothetical protein
VKRLILMTCFLEVGIVLTLAPWSTYWDRNYFAESLPLLRAIVTNNFVRGAVTGVGLVNIAAAVGELVSLFAARRVHDPIITIGRSSALED